MCSPVSSPSSYSQSIVIIGSKTQISPQGSQFIYNNISALCNISHSPVTPFPLNSISSKDQVEGFAVTPAKATSNVVISIPDTGEDVAG